MTDSPPVAGRALSKHKRKPLNTMAEFDSAVNMLGHELTDLVSNAIIRPGGAFGLRLPTAADQVLIWERTELFAYKVAFAPRNANRGTGRFGSATGSGPFLEFVECR
jgi:hypothetical protein